MEWEHQEQQNHNLSKAYIYRHRPALEELDDRETVVLCFDDEKVIYDLDLTEIQQALGAERITFSFNYTVTYDMTFDNPPSTYVEVSVNFVRCENPDAINDQGVML